jgi:hypothetical protein
MNVADDQCCLAYPNCHEPVPGPLVAAQVETNDRPDPRKAESWCHTNREHDHGECGNLLDARNMPQFTRGHTPIVTFSYADRFLLPMLSERESLFAQYGMNRQAREVRDQAEKIREWQSKHLGDLVPAPGVIPVRLDGAA